MKPPVTRKPSECEWCRHLRAMPGEDLCEPCLRKWIRELPSLDAAPSVDASDLEAEDFLKALRSVGGNF